MAVGFLLERGETRGSRHFSNSIGVKLEKEIGGGSGGVRRAPPVPRPLSAVAHPARTPAHTCEVGGGAGGARAGGGRLALLGRYAAEEEDVPLR
jgi:hypothetical protein